MEYICNHYKAPNEYDFLITDSIASYLQTSTHFSMENLKVKPRGNLECGSAQPSLF